MKAFRYGRTIGMWTRKGSWKVDFKDSVYGHAFYKKHPKRRTNRNMVTDWCRENSIREYFIGSGAVYFFDETQALMCYLAFS